MKRNQVGLSKNLMQMKFMQRTKANVEREQAEQQQSNNKLVDQGLLDLCRSEGDKYMTTNSFLFCENLRFGRMSFKGMNPEIEKLMELKNPHQPTTDNASNDDDTTEADVSNNEMAKAFKKQKTQHRYSRR